MGAVVSWSELIFYMALINAVYYVSVIGIFFRREVRALVMRRKLAVDASVALSRGIAGAAGETATQDAALYNAVHELLEECKQVFRAGADEHLAKTQLIEALR